MPRNNNFNSLNEPDPNSKATSSATSLNMMNKPAIMHTSSVAIGQHSTNSNGVNSISPKPYKW